VTADPVLLERLALGGDAVARVDGKAVFVPYGAPGDRVRPARILDEGRFARAWISSLETSSPDRVQPPCPLFFRPGADPDAVCGGCSWQHLSYDAQIRAKRDLLVETLQRVGRIAKPNVLNTIAAASPLRYRNKVQIPVAKGAGRIVAGFYAPGSHVIVPFDDCLIQSERQVAAVRAALAWLSIHPVAVYDSKTERGWLRHLYLRENSFGEILFALVVRDPAFPKGSEFAEELTRRVPFVKSVFLNVNPRPGNVVLGPDWRRLAGSPFLDEMLAGLRFRLSPGTFFQVHHAQAEKLYAQAVEFAVPDPGDNVLELYAGVGAMGTMLAAKAARVWAVEENRQAVRDGIESAGLNGATNIRFITARCEEALARRHPRQEMEGAPLVALLDPPRAGCDPRVLKSVMRLAPKRIVYVSCDPGTLARDARVMSTGGYKLAASVPVDLFPQTAHIESVSLFRKDLKSPTREVS